MSTLDVRRNYADGDILYQSDLDAIVDDLETFLNVTKLTDDNIQDASITGSTKLIDATVTTGKLASSAVTTAKITDSAVTTAKIADSNVTTAKIADSNVTTAKIADSNVTTAKIADSNVTTAKIADSNVTTAKIADSNVTTAKLLDGAVTQAKLGAIVSGTSSSCSTFTTTSTSFTDVTNLSVTLTSYGRPLMIMVIPDGSGNEGYAGVPASASTSFRCLVDGGSIGENYIGTAGANVQNRWPALSWVYPVAAGSHTVKVQQRLSSGTGTVSLYYAKLLVFEL